MAYKTILVHCDASPKVGARLAVAVDLAQRSDARLVGVHVRAPFEAPSLPAVLHAILHDYPAPLEATQGPDLLTRVLLGGRVALGISLSALLLGVGTGSILGMVAGFVQHWSTQALQRVMDGMMALPPLIPAPVLMTTKAGRFCDSEPSP